MAEENTEVAAEAAQEPAADAAEAAAADAPAVALVRMTREGEEPTSADVHPDEVENFAAAGWAVAE